MDSKLQCTQRHGLTVMEEVNCTEVVSLGTLSGSTGAVKTQTVSTLILLRAQEGTPSGAGELSIDPAWLCEFTVLLSKRRLVSSPLLNVCYNYAVILQREYTLLFFKAYLLCILFLCHYYCFIIYCTQYFCQGLI